MRLRGIALYFWVLTACSGPSPDTTPDVGSTAPVRPPVVIPGSVELGGGTGGCSGVVRVVRGELIYEARSCVPYRYKGDPGPDRHEDIIDPADLGRPQDRF